MESSSSKATRKSSEIKRMSSVSIRTLSVNESIAEALRGWPTNALVRIVKTSKRTVENWKQARTGPQAKHIVAMMADDELCAAILPALGRPELAIPQKINTAEKNLAALKSLNQRISSAQAAENRHRKESHEIKESLGVLRRRSRGDLSPAELDGRPVQSPGPVVPGQAE